MLIRNLFSMLAYKASRVLEAVIERIEMRLACRARRREAVR